MRCKLGDISEITKLAGYEFTKYIKYIPDGEIIAVRALNLKNGALVLDDIQRISKEVSEILPRSQLHKNDIVLSYTGTLGECAQIREDGKYHLAPNVCKITPNDSVVNPNFLFQYIRCEKFKQTLINYAHGSTQPTIPMSTIRDIPVDIPDDLEKQGKIAAILSILDEKTAINREINDNLLEQMQALYKSWFVDYLPFGGVIPESWTQTNIYSLANIIYGAPFASKQFNTEGNGKPIIRIRDLNAQQFATYTTEVHPKGYLLRPGDIVVGMDGEFRPYIWGNDEAWLNQRVCVFENKRPNGKAFLYFTIKPLLYAIEQTQVATTVIHIGKKDYDAFEIMLPDAVTLDFFDSLTSPMIMQIVSNSFENKRLAAMRDAMLPRLMSGELDVSAIEI